MYLTRVLNMYVRAYVVIKSSQFSTFCSPHNNRIINVSHYYRQITWSGFVYVIILISKFKIGTTNPYDT